MPVASWNKAVFALSLVCTSLTATTSICGCILYVVLYLSAFSATVPGNAADDLQFWEKHGTKNMITVFVCVEK